MLLLKDNYSTFLHIPKTGGNWVSRVLNDLDLANCKTGDKHDCDPGRHFGFCFVRNPITWYESWFKYQTHIGWINWDKDHPCEPLNRLGSEHFNDFIYNVLQNQPGFVTRLYSCFTDNAQFVGRQENLREDLILILDFQGFDFDRDYVRQLESIGVSPDIPIDWTDELKRAVIEKEHEVFLRYGYEGSLSCKANRINAAT